MYPVAGLELCSQECYNKYQSWLCLGERHVGTVVYLVTLLLKYNYLNYSTSNFNT